MDELVLRELVTRWRRRTDRARRLGSVFWLDIAVPDP